jgi:hypothetical protein
MSALYEFNSQILLHTPPQKFLWGLIFVTFPPKHKKKSSYDDKFCIFVLKYAYAYYG